MRIGDPFERNVAPTATRTSPASKRAIATSDQHEWRQLRRAMTSTTGRRTTPLRRRAGKGDTGGLRRPE